MVNLVSVLKAQVVKQDRETALVDCFTSWDDQLTEDVILGGVQDRLKAIGKPSFAVGLRRSSLTDVQLIDERGLTILTWMILNHRQVLITPNTHWFPYGDRWLFVAGCQVEHFHPAELEKAGKWLMENFHH